MKIFQWVVATVILALLVFIAVSPGITYAPVPRVVIFLLASIFPALLISTTAATKFQLKAGGLLFVTTGASAFFMGVLVLLAHLAKPELQVVQFEVVDKAGERVNMAPYYALTIHANPSGLSVTHFIKGSSVIFVFPEQLVEQRVGVKLSSDGPTYNGVVSYAKRPEGPLQIGKHLK